MLTGFYGLTLPLLKQGLPLRPIQLDNLVRAPGYLNDLRVVVLSYEFMKPMTPGLHLALAQWVQRGGRLIYVGAETDPFHRARDWWNRGDTKYDSPAEHLFETLGLDRKPKTGRYSCEKGQVIVERRHPACFSRSTSDADLYRKLVADALKATGGEFIRRNYLRMRRGPYLIAAVLDESINDTPLQISGDFVDLLDPELAVRHQVIVQPGQQVWLLDLNRVSRQRPLLLAAAGRVETWKVEGSELTYSISSPDGIQVSTRIQLENKPSRVLVDGKPWTSVDWHEASRTLLLRHAGRPAPVSVSITL
jgi:hypothetical protein